MELKNVQFVIENIEAKDFSFFQNFMGNNNLNLNFENIKNNIINQIGQRINGFNSKKPFNGTSLSFEEKRFFHDFGFIIVKNAISPEVYKPALKFINDGISRGEHLKGLGPFGYDYHYIVSIHAFLI